MRDIFVNISSELVHVYRFSVEHILSEASAKWCGRKGRVSLQLLQSLLPEVTTDIPNTYFVCVCGPAAFTQIIER